MGSTSSEVPSKLGISDQYIMAKGGWKNDATLKAIYRGALDDYSRKYNEIANAHFTAMQHEMQHENQKSL